MKHNFIINSRGKLEVEPIQLQKAKLITQYLSTPQGRASLASAMVSPIRKPLDYQGIAAKAFYIQQLPVEPLFKQKIFRINSQGKLIKRIFFLPTFEIYKNPTINISDVKRRRFKMIDR